MNNIHRIIINSNIQLAGTTSSYLQLEWDKYCELIKRIEWDDLKAIGVQIEESSTSLDKIAYIPYEVIVNRELLDLLEITKQRLEIGL